MFDEMIERVRHGWRKIDAPQFLFGPSRAMVGYEAEFDKIKNVVARAMVKRGYLLNLDLNNRHCC